MSKTLSFDEQNKDTSKNTTRFYDSKFVAEKLNTLKHHDSYLLKETKNGGVRKKYGLLLCSLLLTSLLATVLGGVLALAGYYTSRATPHQVKKAEKLLHLALQFSKEQRTSLYVLQSAGLGLLAVGVILFALVIILPALLSENTPKKTQMVASPVTKTSFFMVKQHVQPKKNKTKKFKKKNYDRLSSPELNCAPIFISQNGGTESCSARKESTDRDELHANLLIVKNENNKISTDDL